MEILNVALLSKWKWRILTDRDAVWRDLLEERYGNVKLKVLVGDVSVVDNKDSIWWRDLILSDNYENLLVDNFSSVIRVKVGSGDSTPLWYADWTGKQSLMKIFPSLFSLAANHLLQVSAAGTFLEGCWNWNFRSLFTVEGVVPVLQREGTVLQPDAAVIGSASAAPSVMQQQVYPFLTDSDPADAVLVNAMQAFRTEMDNYSLKKDEDDSFSWRLNSEGVFTVKSCYDFFKGKLSGPPLAEEKVRALIHLWNLKVPSRIQFFCWRFIHNRIATKDNLVSRGILNEGEDSLCVLCSKEEENIVHLFSNCEVSIGIWRRVFMWLGGGDFLSLEDFMDFFYNCSKIKCPSKRVIMAVVWITTIWTLWLKRNAIVFRSESFSFIECMSEIVMVSWSWLISFYKKLPCCNFYGWNTQPLLCFVE
ncbi:uncharacterized protein LOC131625382 [Vicia villosa]|uniref:uncharacterized protein LOC131625382 n=1 Tax=Vicia villosa TaxID=3911 RepID=UPI00273C14B6|nr:uncharacterized protein LOC131625382 [Vicia villosa]